MFHTHTHTHHPAHIHVHACRHTHSHTAPSSDPSVSRRLQAVTHSPPPHTIYLFGEPGEEVPSAQEVQNQVEFPLRLEGCGQREVRAFWGHNAWGGRHSLGASAECWESVCLWLRQYCVVISDAGLERGRDSVGGSAQEGAHGKERCLHVSLTVWRMFLFLSYPLPPVPNH